MPHVSFTDLPLDICDRVLTSLPDFLSLKYAALSSKHLCDAFSLRKRSIMREVGLAEVGPALPFAAALVRTMNMLGKESMQVLLEGLNDNSPDSSFWTMDVTTAEAGTLTSVSSTVRRLESFFCVLYKDRSAALSTLSEEESLRFRRAVYRTWIVSVLTHDNHKLSKPHSLDLDFLKNMTEEEFVEMHQAFQFLDVLYSSLLSRHSLFQGAHHNSRPLDLRLDDLLAYFDGKVTAAIYGIPLQRSATVIVNGIHALHREKQIERLFRQKYNQQSILTSSRVESIQACQKCNTQAPALYGENNWHLLHPTVCFDDIVRCLPGNLWLNSYVRTYMSPLFERRDSYTTLLSEIFDRQNDPESGWNRTDWLCIHCIKRFLKERLFSWFVDELIKAGHKFEDNCWYGWNCRTQTHRPEHAKKLNHLCEPTSRDDTGNTTNIAANSTDQPDPVEELDDEEMDDAEDSEDSEDEDEENTEDDDEESFESTDEDDFEEE